MKPFLPPLPEGEALTGGEGACQRVGTLPSPCPSPRGRGENDCGDLPDSLLDSDANQKEQIP
jgi:hypothetical protein